MSVPYLPLVFLSGCALIAFTSAVWVLATPGQAAIHPVLSQASSLAVTVPASAFAFAWALALSRPAPLVATPLVLGAAAGAFAGAVVGAAYPSLLARLVAIAAGVTAGALGSFALWEITRWVSAPVMLAIAAVGLVLAGVGSLRSWRESKHWLVIVGWAIALLSALALSAFLIATTAGPVPAVAMTFSSRLVLPLTAPLLAVGVVAIVRLAEVEPEGGLLR